MGALSAIKRSKRSIGLSETPPRYDLAPPGLDEHGARIRQWLDTPATTSKGTR